MQGYMLHILEIKNVIIIRRNQVKSK
jgi:hypothetical protein